MTEGSDHSDSFTPSFMDTEYFRLLSSLGSDGASDEGNGPTGGIEDTATPIPEDDGQKPSGSLPSSAFNQGYFERSLYVTINSDRLRFFVVQSELGRGARGVVLKVTHVLDNITLGDYAVKRVPARRRKCDPDTRLLWAITTNT
jgi:hypothetical protein